MATSEGAGKRKGEFTHTVILTGAQQTDATHYIATHHLEGDFPATPSI